MEQQNKEKRKFKDEPNAMDDWREGCVFLLLFWPMHW